MSALARAGCVTSIAELLAAYAAASPTWRAEIEATRRDLAALGPPRSWADRRHNRESDRIWRRFVRTLEGKPVNRVTWQRLSVWREAFTELGAYNTTERYAAACERPRQKELCL